MPLCGRQDPDPADSSGRIAAAWEDLDDTRRREAEYRRRRDAADADIARHSDEVSRLTASIAELKRQLEEQTGSLADRSAALRRSISERDIYSTFAEVESIQKLGILIRFIQ